MAVLSATEWDARFPPESMWPTTARCTFCGATLERARTIRTSMTPGTWGRVKDHYFCRNEELYCSTFRRS